MPSLEPQHGVVSISWLCMVSRLRLPDVALHFVGHSVSHSERTFSIILSNGGGWSSAAGDCTVGGY